MEIKKYSSATSESGNLNSNDSSSGDLNYNNSSSVVNSNNNPSKTSATEEKAKEKEANLLNNLLNAFGGKVIN